MDPFLEGSQRLYKIWPPKLFFCRAIFISFYQIEALDFLVVDEIDFYIKLGVSKFKIHKLSH